MDWDIDDETMAALGGERLTITFDVAELVPGTYVYLSTDDEIIMRGAILDAEDDAQGIPLARTAFDDHDTDPNGITTVGPLMAPRAPGPTRTTTIKGPPIQPRLPVLTPDQILNEIDDDDEDGGGHTMMGPLITPRRPGPAKGKR